MLASRAHVKIDDTEYMLATDEEQHYQHRYESLFAPTTSIAGEIASAQIRPEKLLWSLTDWSGGEGAVIYYPQNPTQYNTASLMNVTQRGQLTTRTKRRRSSVARAGGYNTTASRPVGVSAYSHACIAWGSNIIVSTDAITWSAAYDNTPNLDQRDFWSAVSDGAGAAFLSSGLGNVVPVVNVPSSTTTWDDNETGTTADNPTVGAVLDGVPYVLGTDTTLKVFKKASAMTTAGDWGATTIFNTGITPTGTLGTNYWTSMVAAENALFVSYSTKTHTFVWEIRADVGRPFYTQSGGFAVKKLVYHEGVLFMIGNQAAAGNSFAALHAIPLNTRQSLGAVAEPRVHTNTALSTFSVGCPGLGSTIFCGDEDSGKIFIYDMKRDALSLFDDLANGGTGDGVSFTANTDKIAFLAMHGARLFCATYTPSGSGTSLQVISWDDLQVENRDASQPISASLESAEWHFGLPMELKALVGFYVVYKVTDASTTSGLAANSRITISYSADDASYVDMTTITSSTTPTGGKGRVFIAAPTGASTVKFSRLKIKITLDNNGQSNVAPPILFSVTVEAQPMAYSETWELLLRVEDETSNERPSSRQLGADAIRDKLNTLVTNKQIVTFLDGYSDQNPNQYSTHTVVVEDPIHLIGPGGDGLTRVRLRAVA